MNKLFRPKCLRRVLLCLALLFPIVYLCGGLFFTLAGAHGEQMFAEPIYTNQYIEIENLTNDGDYQIQVDDYDNFLTNLGTNLPNGSSNTLFNFSFANRDFKRIYFYSTNSIINAIGIFPNINDNTNGLTLYENGTYYQRPWLFNFNLVNNSTTLPNLFLATDSVTLKKLLSVPTEVIPNNHSAYTDFIFSQPFAKNNFITNLGKDLVNGSEKGFNPMNELFRTINTNIMHFNDTDGIAMFGLGYVYYAVNVLIIYEVLILAVKLIMLPLRAVELFDKKEDI